MKHLAVFFLGATIAIAASIAYLENTVAANFHRALPTTCQKALR